MPSQPVTSRDRRARPERAQHPAILVAGAQLPGDSLRAEDQGDRGRKGPESAQRDRLRLDGELHFGDDPRGHVELIGESPRDEADELFFHRRDAAWTVVELERIEHRRSRGGRRRYRRFEERRGQLRDAVDPVDVVFNDFVVRDDDPHHLDVEPEAGRHCRRAEPWRVGLGIRIEPHRHDLADPHAEDLRGALVHYHLVRSVRFRHPTRDDGQSVLV